ncbi:MAG TPA: carboxypeptidase regulatory-like domain-containing protein [Candidatus Cybelea sp.]|nr:carboxypeptidase regulatory-like domain-containing protein [Candidatus Cybelea sp.]
MKRFASALLAIQICLFCSLLGPAARGQTGNSGTIAGTVVDPSGGVMAKATVTIHNPVSGYESTTTTDASGKFAFSNVPYNPYHLTVSATGFASYAQDVELRSGVPVNLEVTLAVAGSNQTVTVEGGADLLENTPTDHTDISREIFERVPLESVSSSLSSLVTQASPGVAADSNGLFHGLGDHAENSFSIDGQPVTDQQSKVFSNQLPVDAVQSMEVIDGAPPAQYGDKTSLVIDVTTRSGQGMTSPHGGITLDYGSFGTSTADFHLGYGGQNWGNFISLNGLNTGRFLDPPEFVVMHDKGNEENLFDRVDYQLNSADSIHLNLSYSRSWFQTPNSYDATYASPWWGDTVANQGLAPSPADGCDLSFCGEPVGPTDQRSQIGTFIIAPTWTHLINSSAVVTLGTWVRRDAYNYYPSDDPFSDLGPFTLQRESVSQYRTLTNAGGRAGLSYVKGIHDVKAGLDYEQTFLSENDHLGIVDPTVNAPCLGPNSNPNTEAFYPLAPVEGFTDPSQCAAAGYEPNTLANPDPRVPGNPANGFVSSALYPLYSPTLAPYDLTRGGTLFDFIGHTDVKELALYVEDAITKGAWNFSLGMRGDVYNGMTSAAQAEPRLGIAYNIKESNTVLRVSYARTLETPFNENLVLSSIGCSNPVLGPQDGISGTGLLLCSSPSLTPIAPGYRNEFHAGLQQAFGRHVVIDGEYIWKYTHNGYDFSVLGNTPITFPIEWHNSKIPGFTERTNITDLHGFTAYIIMSSVAARFFTPQIGGAGATPSAIGAFRIDHDEHYNQETHLQYQPSKRWPWLAFNWRYDSGLVAGATPCYGSESFNDCPGYPAALSAGQVSMVAANVVNEPLSADQEFEAGFTCNSMHAAPPSAANPAGTPLSYGGVVGICPATSFSSNLVKIPAPNKEDDDLNPPRIQQRNLFDVAVGDDNLFNGDRHQWSARIMLINLTNNYVLYNFLSTFSGTHYVTPRTVSAEVGFHF